MNNSIYRRLDKFNALAADIKQKEQDYEDNPFEHERVRLQHAINALRNSAEDILDLANEIVSLQSQPTEITK